MFPNGEVGYELNIPKGTLTVADFFSTDIETNNKKIKYVSANEYYRYRIMFRSNQFNIILRCGKLTQQYVVDMYLKVESFRLEYCQNHQKELRSEKYIRYQDAIRSNIQTKDIGKSVTILPSSFIGKIIASTIIHIIIKYLCIILFYSIYFTYLYSL